MLYSYLILKIFSLHFVYTLTSHYPLSLSLCHSFFRSLFYIIIFVFFLSTYATLLSSLSFFSTVTLLTRFLVANFVQTKNCFFSYNYEKNIYNNNMYMYIIMNIVYTQALFALCSLLVIRFFSPFLFLSKISIQFSSFIR